MPFQPNIRATIAQGVVIDNVQLDTAIEVHSNFALGMDIYTHADQGFRAPYINLAKSRGTQSSPTPPTLTGYEQDSIGGINFRGWDGSSYFVAAGVYTQVSNNWDSNNRGAFISIYGTRQTDGALPQQIIQFGGIDGSDQNAGGGTIDQNIISYRSIAFGGNKFGNPCIVPQSSGDVAIPAKLQLKNGDDSGWCSLDVGVFACIPGSSVTPSVNGQLTFEATSNTQVKVKLKGSDGTVRSATLTLS